MYVSRILSLVWCVYVRTYVPAFVLLDTATWILLQRKKSRNQGVTNRSKKQQSFYKQKRQMIAQETSRSEARSHAPKREVTLRSEDKWLRKKRHAPKRSEAWIPTQPVRAAIAWALHQGARHWADMVWSW